MAYEQCITNKYVLFISATNGSIINVPVRSLNSDPYTITLTRPRPRAYVFSRAYSDVAQRLRILGVTVTSLQKLDAEELPSHGLAPSSVRKTIFVANYKTSLLAHLNNPIAESCADIPVNQ